MLLYIDEAIAVRLLLNVIPPSCSMACSVNPLSIISLNPAGVSFTKYPKLVAPLAVQVNSTVVPSTAVTETGLTRKTEIKTRKQTLK